MAPKIVQYRWSILRNYNICRTIIPYVEIIIFVDVIGNFSPPYCDGSEFATETCVIRQASCLGALDQSLKKSPLAMKTCVIKGNETRRPPRDQSSKNITDSQGSHDFVRRRIEMCIYPPCPPKPARIGRWSHPSFFWWRQV